MSGVTITNSELKIQCKAFVEEAQRAVQKSFSATVASTEYEQLYKACLSFNSVLGAMQSPSLKPTYAALRSIVKRIPLLVAMGQPSLVYVELRRLTELLFWSIYFTHHPVEWQNLIGKRGSGYSRDQRKPISYATHRDLNAFFEYATEYMEIEPSGLATKAISALLQEKGMLHASTHAGEIAREPENHVPVTLLSRTDLRNITGVTSRILSAAAVLICAFNKDKFDRMPAGPRAYFDRLVGESTRKSIRKGQFGVPLHQPS